MANRTATAVGLASAVLVFTSLMTIAPAAMALESVLSPGPTIADPGPLASEHPEPAGLQTPTPFTKTLTLIVYPKDADRLAATIAGDVAHHGGATVRNQNGRNMIFDVSSAYLDRLQPLADDPGSFRQVGRAYPSWAAAAVPAPGHAPPVDTLDTTLYINLAYPLTANAATLPMMAVAGLTAGAALLALLTSMAVYQATKETARTGGHGARTGAAGRG